MTSLKIDSFLNECGTLNDQIEISYDRVSPSIMFSNTGRRGGKKYFSISLAQLRETFLDIKNNIGVYRAHGDYSEDAYRALFSSTLSNKAVKALSTVQTLPLYEVLNTVNCVANGLEPNYSYKSMDFDDPNIDNTIKYIESQLPDDAGYLACLDKTPTLGDFAGENVIYYGAPGSGKSHAIDEACAPSIAIRTVFHPDTQYSDFVGCLRPRSNNADIEYSFREGPFTKALISAHNNRKQKVYLIIEELNRASAAAVFGEVFQLLDRKESGESTYSITLVDTDMAEYLENEACGLLVDSELRLPSNLYIWATMNSSDQAVLPMDTAFKRRWRFEYVPNNFNKCPKGSLLIPVRGEDSPISVSWPIFAQSVNEELEKEGIPEDRYLGPWFLSEIELKDSEASEKALRGKLLLYLWDDVLRHHPENTIFDSDIKGYGTLSTRLAKGSYIFAEAFEDILKNKLKLTETTGSEGDVQA